ncbi:MAG: solute-binding protein [Anaerolineales bacterium]|nr:solute-binding protein [Anaerolineales bacterium]
MVKKVLVLVGIVMALVAALAGCATPTEAPTVAPTVAPTEAPAEEGTRLLLATTTSTQDSGLLDVILPDFEKQAGVSVDVVAVGTGQAIEMGEGGNADVLLVHARAKEDAFMEAGHGVRREDVMYNDFVIVGPAEDPAGISGLTDAVAAFSQIAEAQATFISRGDDSGTHVKEKDVWAAAGIEPSGDWYVSSGQGMGEVLTMADEQQAYTLSDRATYLARTLEGIDLEVLAEGDPILFNPYGVIAVNPDKGDHIQAELANQFIDWIISVPTQEMISEFGVEEFGSPLFVPDSALWNEAHAGAEGAGTETEEVGLSITGMVAEEMAWSDDEVYAFETISVDYTNKDGETTTYTGVPLAYVLDLAGVEEGATTLMLVASDGYSAEFPLSDAEGCESCIVGFDEDEGIFRMVLPDFSSKVQVKDVVEIQVQ